MKRLLAITLLTVYIFNFVGYYLVYAYFISYYDKELVQQIDNKQYSDSDLIEVKIPLHLPYNYSWSNYERVDGEIEYNGTYYTYVKRKVTNDTLYILCLPNVIKREIYAAQNNYSKQANDIPSEKNNNSSAKKFVLIQYYQPIKEYCFNCLPDIKDRQAFCFASPLTQSIIDSCFQPPELTA